MKTNKILLATKETDKIIFQRILTEYLMFELCGDSEKRENISVNIIILWDLIDKKENFNKYILNCVNLDDQDKVTLLKIIYNRSEVKQFEVNNE